MTIVEVVAILVGAALGWASGALKAQLHSLRGPQGSLGSGGDCRRGFTAPAAPRRDAPENEQQPHATRQVMAA